MNNKKSLMFKNGYEKPSYKLYSLIFVLISDDAILIYLHLFICIHSAKQIA